MLHLFDATVFVFCSAFSDWIVRYNDLNWTWDCFVDKKREISWTLKDHKNRQQTKEKLLKKSTSWKYRKQIMTVVSLEHTCLMFWRRLCSLSEWNSVEKKLKKTKEHLKSIILLGKCASVAVTFNYSFDYGLAAVLARALSVNYNKPAVSSWCKVTGEAYPNSVNPSVVTRYQ